MITHKPEKQLELWNKNTYQELNNETPIVQTHKLLHSYHEVQTEK